jgi:hypothetical protein
MPTPDSPTAQPRLTGRIWFALLLFSLAVTSLGAAILFEQKLIPFLLAHTEPGRITPVMRQTLFIRSLTLWFFAPACTVAAIFALLVPRDKWNIPLLTGCVIAAALLLRMTTPDIAFDLMARPDAVHFAATASSLIENGSFLIATGPHTIAPRTLPGGALVLCATQWLNPDHWGWGIFGVLACSWLTVLLAYALAARLFSKRAGVAAALLVALSPMHAWYSRHLMSDVPWGLLVLCAAYLVVFAPLTSRRALAAGLLLGLGMLMKPSHLLIAAGMILAIGIASVRNRERVPLSSLALLVAGAIVATLPLLLYNRLILGAWNSTPYHVYWPGWATLTNSMNIRYLWAPPLINGKFGNLIYYPIAFLGLDPRPERMPSALPVVLLVLFSIFAGIRRKRNVPTSLLPSVTLWVCLFYGVACVLYSFQDTRLFLPVLPLVMVMLSPWVANAFERVPRAILPVVLLVVLLGLCSIGLGMICAEAGHIRPSERELGRDLAVAIKDFDVLVSDEDPVLLTHYGVWTEQTPLVPLLLEGELWFPGDPRSLFATNGTVVSPYRGTVADVEEFLADGKRVAVWIRRARFRPDAYGLFTEAFDITPLRGYGIPSFGEAHARQP